MQQAATPPEPIPADSACLPALREIAEKLLWWQPADLSLQQPLRFLAQAMTLGNWNDLQVVRQAYSEDALRAVLRHAPAGVFDARSWAYWHHVFDIRPVPDLPKRLLE